MNAPTQILLVVENGAIQCIEASDPVQVLIIDLDVRDVPRSQRTYTEFGPAYAVAKTVRRDDCRPGWVARRLRGFAKSLGRLA